MKFRLTVSLLGLALTAALAAPVWAQAPPSSPAAPPNGAVGAPSGDTHDKAHGERGSKLMTRIKTECRLTDEQAQKLKPMLRAYHDSEKLRTKSAREQRSALLTPEQQAITQQRRTHGAKGSADWGGGGDEEAHKGGGAQGGQGQRLNLTDDQKTKMRAIREASKSQHQSNQQALFSQTRTVLNAEQESRLEQIIQHPSRGEAGKAKGERRSHGSKGGAGASTSQPAPTP